MPASGETESSGEAASGESEPAPAADDTAQIDFSVRAKLPFPVVGIGASAGAILAFCRTATGSRRAASLNPHAVRERDGPTKAVLAGATRLFDADPPIEATRSDAIDE